MLNIQGARTQHLWGKDKTGLFANNCKSLDEAKAILAQSDDKVIEVLWPAESGWNSVLRENLQDKQSMEI